MSYRGKRKGSNSSLLRRAKSVQARRSGHAKAIDSQLKAPKARSVTQWLSAPNRYDLPNVDLNKPQQKEDKPKSMQIPKEEALKNQYDFDRLVDKDDISSNQKNKQAYEKILELLDSAKIPYRIGGQGGIYVHTEDMKRAYQLIEKQFKILRETS